MGPLIICENWMPHLEVQGVLAGNKVPGDQVRVFARECVHLL